MTAWELLSYLRKHEIDIWVEHDKICVRVKKEELPSRVKAGLAECRDELLRILKRLDASVGSGAPVIPRAPRDGALPLSFAQSRLWFMDQFEPNSPFYNVGIAMWLQGPLDRQALQKSLEVLCARHETLRTSFPDEDGAPVQLIAETPSEVFGFDDLSGLPREPREAEALRLAREEAQRPFDLSTGPLLRVRLLRFDAQDHILMLTMHHIVSDGWSMGVLNRELSSCYEAFSRGEVPSLPELPLQYVDFAVWQRQWLQGQVLDEQLSYWKRTLADLPTLQLPADYARPPIQSYKGSLRLCVLPEGLSKALIELSRREETTLFMTMLAAFKALLHRYAGQEDLVVGTPIANRNRAETEGMIGFFVNMLVMRTQVTGDLSFVELLGRVRENTLEAYAHQDLPFEKLVEELDPPRDPSRNPLFQVLFAVQGGGESLVSLPGLTVKPLSMDVETTKVDLEIFVVEAPEGISLCAVFSTALFKPLTIDLLLESYRRLLEEVVENPQQQLKNISILSEESRRRILVEWNATGREYRREATVHALFEEQAARSPEAVAVVFEGEQLSYGELDRRGNKLAHRLRGMGVGPDVLVGLYMERSLEMVVGLLGVLKAGGAYVPLDPSYPRKRLAFMLEDTGAVVLLTQERLLGELPQSGAQVICMDRDWGGIEGEGEGRLESGAGAESLAYVMYTSGSTGEPKGVAVVHRGVVRLVCNTDYVQLGPQEVILQFAPISFDASTFEIWGALLNGGRLVVSAPGTPSLEELGAVIRGQGVSTLWLTSALFTQMVEWRLEDLGGVRQLLAGGDVLSVGHVKKVLEAPGEGVLINGYGPTENTTFSCCHVMRRGGSVGRSVPIGRPIANTKVYVLDGWRQAVPVGVAGELYIGGDGLARGYLKRAELTGEKFVADPFSADGKGRLYRTGDLVRWQEEGTLEFLGRMDSQVKLRGFRIELGEVEAVLRGHPGVGEAVAMVREDTPGEKRLVAYVVRRGETAPAGSELRGYLKERLPEYMVPSAFVVLEELPLSPSGKVDRKGLPAPEGVRSEEEAYVAPRTELEREIAKVWREVLKLEKVGVNDNFFEIGGHSLLVIEAHVKLRQSAGTRVSIVEIFQHPTIRSLAEHLSREGAGQLTGNVIQDRARRQREALLRRREAKGRGNLNNE